MVTNAELMRRYHEFNRKYFHNKLPKDMVVEFGESKNWLGVTRYRKTRPLFIQINKRFRFSLTCSMMTLLHEMVHVELPYGVNHGPIFHKRMLQLAKTGAFKAWW